MPWFLAYKACAHFSLHTNSLHANQVVKAYHSYNCNLPSLYMLAKIVSPQSSRIESLKYRGLP